MWVLTSYFQENEWQKEKAIKLGHVVEWIRQKCQRNYIVFNMDMAVFKLMHTLFSTLYFKGFHILYVMHYGFKRQMHKPKE